MSDDKDDLLRSIRRLASRRSKSEREGPPSFGRQLAQAGVLGWIIVLPTLLGALLGRWVDRSLATGIFWTAPMMLVGLAIGCHAGWRWIHQR
jgi:ATP synthase protein I